MEGYFKPTGSLYDILELKLINNQICIRPTWKKEFLPCLGIENEWYQYKDYSIKLFEDYILVLKKGDHEYSRLYKKI